MFRILFSTSQCIAFDFTFRSMNKPLFITTPKNGDPTSMFIHEIAHENGNVHFGNFFVPKVAFEDGDVHILKFFINFVELSLFMPKINKARKSMW